MMSITVEPTGALGIPLLLLHNLVAASPTFAASVSGDPASHVYIQADADDMADDKLPFAVAALGSDWNWQTVAGGEINVPHHEGNLILVLKAMGQYPGEGQEKDDLFAFCNWVDGIVADLWAYAGVSDNLDMTSLSLAQQPTMTSLRKPSGQATVWTVVFAVGYNEHQ